MPKRIFFSLVCMIFSQYLFSQNLDISGKIEDTTAKASVRNAVVVLLSSKDSILEKFIRTDAAGNFILKNVQKGQHILMVMHPLFADYVDNIDMEGTNIMVGTIPVTSKSKLLEAVIIKSGNPIRIKRRYYYLYGR